MGMIIQLTIRPTATLALAGTNGSEATVPRRIPFDGVLTEVEPSWEAGTNQLVHQQLLHEGQLVWPYEGDVALTNVTPKYRIRVPVLKGQYIWGHFWNGDAGNTHRVAITVTLEGK